MQHKADITAHHNSRNESVAYEPSEQLDSYSTHVIKAIEYIRINYSNKISLSSLSEELYVHPTYLSNLFKKQTGTNIVDYINNYRIEVAKDLLKDSRNKIYWVAERVGFVNQRYFSQKFKKNYGIYTCRIQTKGFLWELTTMKIEIYIITGKNTI